MPRGLNRAPQWLEKGNLPLFSKKSKIRVGIFLPKEKTRDYTDLFPNQQAKFSAMHFNKNQITKPQTVTYGFFKNNKFSYFFCRTRFENVWQVQAFPRPVLRRGSGPRPQGQNSRALRRP